MAQRLGRPAGALAACATLALAAAALVTATPGHLLVGAAVSLALVWSCAPLVVALCSPRGSVRSGSAGATDDLASDDRSGRPATVTTFVRLGDEPPEIARSTVALARRAGPTVIVARERDVPTELALEADAVHTAATIEEAVRSAATRVDTDAVLLLSARTVPDLPACREAAALLDEHVGWVTGSSHPFNRDRYASDRREVVGTALRRRAAGTGVALWENDATLVRTDLLAEHAIRPGRPWGAWLRERSADGLRGAQVDAALSLRSAPVAAGAFWPDALARQRVAALDVAGATRSGPWRARVAAALLLSRDLYVYPLLVWLLTPVLMGDGFAFSLDPWWCVGAVLTAALARWWSLRAALGVEPMPRADVVAAVYHSPGSLFALGTVLRGRVRPSRHAAPTRPLVWAALALTVVAAYGLLRHRPGESASRVAVALSLVMLGVLWAFTVRSLVEKNWSRTSYRVRLRRPATVDGIEAETVDGSPGGIAVRGRFPVRTYPVGAEATIDVALDDGSSFSSPAVVAARRRSRGTDLLGLELHPGPDALDDWSAQLLRVSATPTDHERSVPLEPQVRRGRLAVMADRMVMGAVVLTSLAVVVALVLVLLGFRPLVVRSGSMVPTYQVGDIVLVEQIRADELRAGEVVTLAYYPEYGESLTHRVRSVRRIDGAVQVETRGDANDSSEVWAVAPDALVGRVVASVPAVGTPATLVRTAGLPLLIGVLVLAVVVALVIWGHRLRRPARPQDGSSDDVRADEVGDGLGDAVGADDRT